MVFSADKMETCEKEVENMRNYAFINILLSFF